MTDAATGRKRTDSASRLVHASPQTIYRAFLDPEAWISWLPPEGMNGHIDAFDAREGGGYRMTLRYDDAEYAEAGKTLETPMLSRGGFSGSLRTSGSFNKWSSKPTIRSLLVQ